MSAPQPPAAGPRESRAASGDGVPADERLPVSVMLLARDETRDVEALLPALDFAAEVVVLWDSAGDPATREAAERLGARVYERRLDGFGAQRQFALERCTQPWVLWIDADERPGPRVAAALRRALPGLSPDSGLLFERRGWFMGRRIRHCGWSDERVLRLFPREASRFDDALVHEKVRTPKRPRAGVRDLVLEHHSYATWEGCVTKLVRYAHANADQAHRDGRRAGPLDLAWRPPLRFVRQYVLQLGFLDGAHGLVLCGLAAAQVYLKYAELWARSSRSARDARP